MDNLITLIPGNILESFEWEDNTRALAQLRTEGHTDSIERDDVIRRRGQMLRKKIAAALAGEEPAQLPKALADLLEAEVKSFRDDPLGFVLFAFPWSEPGTLAHETGPDTWQRVFLNDLGRHIRDRNFNGNEPVDPIRMAVASGHGIGKSALGAMLFWFIMSTRRDALGRVTANTYSQLEVTTWAEICRWWERLICQRWFEVSGSRVVRIGSEKKWFATPQTCSEENSESFAGQHCKTSTSFFIFDESSTIPDVIFEVAEAGLTDGEPMMFVFGNPTRNTGEFFEVCFGKRRHRWNVRSIDSRTCKFPNHALHDQWIEDHGMDSDYVRVRILGQAPRQSESQLIGRDLVESAQQRQVSELLSTPLIAGVDVPDGGSAWFVIRFRRGLDSRPGQMVPHPIRIAGSKIDRQGMVTGCARILHETNPLQKVAMMFIDSAFGAAVAERLRALGFENVQEVTFGAKSPDKGFANMRAFMWAKEMKDWLGKGAIDPEDKKLAYDLSGPGFHFKLGGDGALVVESKEEMRRRGIPSPDDGDALALTFACPVEPESQQLGTSQRGSYADTHDRMSWYRNGWMG